MTPDKEYKGRSHIRMFNCDCMDFMEDCDRYDLAIIDPPYGIKRFEKSFGTTRFKSDKRVAKNGLKWDTKPDKYYFKTLFETSENQIIWGGNNFELPPTEYFCIWDKKQTVDNFATAEYAYVSMGLKKPAKIYRYGIHIHNHTHKIHPTQKPLSLYKWLLKNYAKEGDTILDTHGGSMSIAIACWDLGFDLDIIELDTDYFNDAVKRFESHISQTQLF